MSSLLCVKSLNGHVQVHDPETAGNLNVDDEETPKKVFHAMARGKEKRMPDCKWSTMDPRKCAQSVPLCSKASTHTGFLPCTNMKIPDWVGNIASTNSPQNKEVQDSISHDSYDIQAKYSTLLETEKTFVQDLSKYVQHTDMLGLRKKELLHKNWNDRVYEPIRRKIVEVMNGKSWPDVDQRQREIYRQYLEHLNKKGHVFLDTQDPGEYYAQALNSHRPAPITVHTPQLHDPLLSQSRERNREDQTILRCTTGQIYSLNDIEQIKLPPLPLVPLGRHSANSVTWLEMPYGHIESAARKGSRLRMKGNCTDTQIDFERWSKLAFNPRTLDREMKTQKKRFFQETPPFGCPAKQCSNAPFVGSTTNSDYGAVCPVSA